MKVSDLIIELGEYNQDADVSLIDSEDICISYISENGETQKDTKHLFIEGCDDVECGTCKHSEYIDGTLFCNLLCEDVEIQNICSDYVDCEEGG